MNSEANQSEVSAVPDEAMHVLDELLTLDGHLPTESHLNGAYAFDQLHSESRQVLDLLERFGSQLQLWEEKYSFDRLDPVRGSRTQARSCHGLLADWANRASSYAKTYGRQVCYLMERLAARAHESATAVGLVGEVFDAMGRTPNPIADPSHADRTAFIHELSDFAEKLRCALDGFQQDAQLIREGIKLELRRGQVSGGGENVATAATSPAPKPIDEKDLGVIEQKLLARLRSTPEVGVTVKDLDNAANIRRDSPNAKKQRDRILRKMKRLGLIRRVGRGLYRASAPA